MNKPPEDGEPPSYPHFIGIWDRKGRRLIFSAKGLSAVLVLALGIVLAAGVAVWAMS